MSDAPERIWCLPGETDDLRLNPKDWARPCNDAIPYIRADFVDALIREAIQSAEAERDALRAALDSIANNTCCEGCQEAALVARQALKGTNHD